MTQQPSRSTHTGYTTRLSLGQASLFKLDAGTLITLFFLLNRMHEAIQIYKFLLVIFRLVLVSFSVGQLEIMELF